MNFTDFRHFGLLSIQKVEKFENNLIIAESVLGVQYWTTDFTKHILKTNPLGKEKKRKKSFPFILYLWNLNVHIPFGMLPWPGFITKVNLVLI